MQKIANYLSRVSWKLFFLGYTTFSYGEDNVDIEGVSRMLSTGQDMIKVAAKWGGIMTVVGAALALGSGRLEGALAQTVCKVVIVIALIIAAYGYFGKQIAWGLSF